MNTVTNKIDLQNALFKSVSHLTEGYWVTLNSLTNNEIKFVSNLQELANRLNIYCYGNTYRNGLKRLEIRGALQTGNVYEGLHTHIVVMKNGETKRNDFEIEKFIRQHWYRLIGARGNIYGNLVDFQPVSNIESRIQYALRDFKINLYQKNQLIYL